VVERKCSVSVEVGGGEGEGVKGSTSSIVNRQEQEGLPSVLEDNTELVFW
jgi:hypothetical protein